MKTNYSVTYGSYFLSKIGSHNMALPLQMFDKIQMMMIMIKNVHYKQLYTYMCILRLSKHNQGYHFVRIVRNLRSFAKKLGRCTRDIDEFLVMSGNFRNFVWCDKWRYYILYVFLFNVEKRVECKIKHLTYFDHTY